MQQKPEIYTTVTNQIVAAIEDGQIADKFILPWNGKLAMPMNITSGKLYRGINILNLWVVQMACGYASSEWATYKQWQERGAQVRKGEAGTTIVFWKQIEVESEADNEEAQTRMFAKASRVFNAAQVDGYEPQAIDTTNTIDAIADVDALVAHTRADIRIGGADAYYLPSGDYICLPDMYRFQATQTLTAQEGYYATLLHELTHWTGAKHRLDRLPQYRANKQDRAFEELVAELGSAMLCALLGIAAETRVDHAQYIHGWLRALKDDKRFIFSAASKAQQAVDFILAFAPESQQQAA